MSAMTLEGVVEDGQIRLKTDLHLPDNTKVYIVVPDVEVEGIARIYTPHLANPAQAADFRLEISEEPIDAGV